MTPEIVMDIGLRALEVTLIVMMITLLPALVVGLLVSVFQAATQINEATLSFVPKLLVTGLTFVVAGPYMLGLLTDYIQQIFHAIPTLAQ
jgi:flagellar biosynthesis protein FliQ